MELFLRVFVWRVFGHAWSAAWIPPDLPARRAGAVCSLAVWARAPRPALDAGVRALPWEGGGESSWLPVAAGRVESERTLRGMVRATGSGLSAPSASYHCGRVSWDGNVGPTSFVAD